MEESVQEKVWGGHRPRRTASVEDCPDEDDLSTGGLSDGEGEGDDELSMEWPLDDGEDDEFTAISVWDEIAEGILRAAGRSGMGSLLPFSTQGSTLHQYSRRYHGG